MIKEEEEEKGEERARKEKNREDQSTKEKDGIIRDTNYMCDCFGLFLGYLGY